MNKISRIAGLDDLKELRELNMSFNRIEVIEHLGKLGNLKTLNLNHNKIRRLENLKNLRKLEVISLTGNLLEDLTVYGGAPEPLLELREIHVARNKIQLIRNAFNIFPNVSIDACKSDFL
jgi:protein phosphatase 1 regulatory subunit 7